MRFNRTHVFATMLIFTSAAVIFGQDPTPSPAPAPSPSADELRLQEEIRILTLEKDKAELEKKIRDAVPTPASMPSPATASFSESDKLNFEIEMQSYKAMRRVTDNIACDVRKAQTGAFTVVLYKSEEYAAWRNFNLIAPTLRVQLAGMKEEYRAWLRHANNVQFNEAGTATAVAIPTPIPVASPSGTPGVGVSGGGAPPLLAATTGISTALAGITGSVKAFAELMSLFKSDITFTQKDVQLDAESLKASLNGSFRATKDWKADGKVTCTNDSIIKILDPANYSPVGATGGAYTSRTISDIEDLVELQRGAAILIALYEVVAADANKVGAIDDKIEKVAEDLKKKKDEIKPIQEKWDKAKGEEKQQLWEQLKPLRAVADALEAELKALTTRRKSATDKLKPYEDVLSIPNRVRISRLKELNTEFAAFVTAFTASANNGPSVLSQYVRAENLNAALNSGDVFWMRVNGVKAGGNTRVVKNLIRYFYQPSVTHSGGAIIEYSLSDKDGSVVVGNTDSLYLKYEKASKIQR